MRYILLGLTSLLTTSVVSNVFVKTEEVYTQEHSDPNIYNIEKSNYPYISNLSNQQSISDNVEYRIYIDSTGDGLTPTENKIDFNWGNRPKNQWHDLELQIANYNFTDYDVNNRNDLISKIGNKFNLSFYYAFNMWDSKKGWRYKNGKNNALTKVTSIINLKTEAITDEIKYEKTNSGTEAGRIQIRQEWETNKLKIFLRMSVWYYWAWGSLINHASLAKFSLTNINNGESSPIRFDSKIEKARAYQSMTPGTSSISLNSLFDNARNLYQMKKKEGWKILLPLFTTYSVAGPMICTKGFGYATINLFSYQPLFNDIAFTMVTGSLLNGKLKTIVKNVGTQVICTLYYVAIDSTSIEIGDIKVPLSIGAVSITYAGASILSYIFSF